MSDVFQRQRGLVDQAKLSKLSVRLADRAVFPQQFIQSFELIEPTTGGQPILSKSTKRCRRYTRF